MSAIAAYAVEAETAKELKKGQFKLYHQKTPPTNVVLLDIHDTDTEEVKYVKGLINQMRQELGSSTDLIKIEPETALFNILYTKKEVDQLVVSTGAGFNLPMFLSSVLIAGANMIKLRSDTGERVNTERYEENFSVTADNFEYVYLKLKEYAERLQTHAERIQDLANDATIFNSELETLTSRVDELEDDLANIEECHCDKEWMSFMQYNFKMGILDSEIIVSGNLDLQGKYALSGLTEINSDEGQLTINGTTYVTKPLTAPNLPPQLTFRPNGLTNYKEPTDDGVVDYNTYGKWYQATDVETFGSIDVDNRLRINTLNDNKTSIIKTVDVGAALENYEERIEALEAGGGGGSGEGFWKRNPTHMQSLPEHQTLETYDFNAKASSVIVSDTDVADIKFVCFPDLSVDLTYDRAQFIEVKSTNPNRTYYLSTKDGQMEIPMIVDYQTGREEMVKTELDRIGLLWKRQFITKDTVVDGFNAYIAISTSSPFREQFAVYGSSTFLSGSEEKPLKIVLEEFRSDGKVYRTSEYILKRNFTGGSIEGTTTLSDGTVSTTYLTNLVGGYEPVPGEDVPTNYLYSYYVDKLYATYTADSKWTFSEAESEVSLEDYLQNCTFSYTPDRDKIINNEPVTITSTQLVKNDTAILAPNAFDLHKYGGVKDYEITLDKLVVDSTSVVSYNKISFKDFQIGGDYIGPIFTIYFGTTRFMMNNEQILTPISCYRESNGKYYTDQLLKKDGFWTTERVETDVPCFLWSKTVPITLNEAYNVGEITIKYIPRKSTLSTEHDVICREVLADNSLDLYRSTTPNFYNPKIIDDVVHNKTLTSTETNTYSTITHGVPGSARLEVYTTLEIGDQLHCYDYSLELDYTVLIDTVNEFDDNGIPVKVSLSDIETGTTTQTGQNIYALTFMTNNLFTQIVDIIKHTTVLTNSSETYYVIDFGFATNSEEFKKLPEGFRFRFIDPVFNYNYEAVKENDDWKFKYGNLHPNVNTSRFATDGPLWFGNWYNTDFPVGPCIIMNNSNEIALTYLVKHCLGRDVSGWENLWKALWTDSRAKITTTGPLTIDPNETHVSKKSEGKNQYCSIAIKEPDGFSPELGKNYSCSFELTINTEVVDVDLKFEYTYVWGRDEALEETIGKALKTYDCYEVLDFSQHSELTFEYDERGKGLRFYASPDFLLWKTDINYQKGTNIFRFLYDRDYVQIEPRPESCSALMTDKNIITDGIVVAQNLETHLHSLNQVANVTEETIQRMQYTDAVLSEIIGNLASLNEFVRLTIMLDFISLGFSGLMGIVKFGEGVMKNGLRSTLRLDEMPVISTAVRDGAKYTRIGEATTDLVHDARSMELIARDTLREEAQAIESQAMRHVHHAEEDFSLFAGGEFSTEASEISIASSGSASFSSLEDLMIDAPNVTINSDRATFGQLLEENSTLLAIDGSAESLATYGRTVGDYILGTFNRIGGTIKNGCGIVFNSANIASLLENIWWVLDTYKDAIGWSIQFGTNVYKLCEFKRINNELAMYFTPDRFIWSVVDAANVRTEHAIKGIAKYNEMSGWDDEKLITGQALLENYYSKSDIDSMFANSNSGSSNEAGCTLDKIYYEDDKSKVTFEPYSGYGFNIKNTYKESDLNERLYMRFNGNATELGHIQFFYNKDTGNKTTDIALNGINLTSTTSISNKTQTVSFGSPNITTLTVTLQIGVQKVRLMGDLQAPNIYTKTEVDELISSNETITHKTNVIGEIGTFCESNGKIYDGYKEIKETDCICQVKQSKSLNKKIIGIITSETQFASHGDVLVKVNDISDCAVGDILCPDENGCGKVASDQDLMFMMLHAIPRPKITCINTGIDNMVACFIV